ncbi:MAG: hypothetical protein IT546_10950 [Caulobacteraceae bacterium]|nr:hypothetical protein [Caulobacteraceae bacterium]
MSPPAARPSFDLGRVVGATFTSFGRTAPLLLPLALALVALPGAILGCVAVAVTISTGSPDGALLGPLNRLLDSILQLVMQAAAIQAVMTHWAGRKPELKDCAGATRHLLALFGIQIIAGVGIVLGLLLLIVPGLILAAAWCVAAPVRVVEGRGVFDSLGRSLELTRGARLPILGLLIGGIVVMVIIFAVVSGIGSAAAATTWPAAAGYVEAVLDAVAGAVAGVFQSIGLAAIFFELRRIKEGAGPDAVAAVFD